MLTEVWLSHLTKKAFVARWYASISDFAFSVSVSILDDFILRVLRDDPAPGGGVFGNAGLTQSAVLMHVEAGRIWRLHSEWKACTSNTATSVAV